MVAKFAGGTEMDRIGNCEGIYSCVEFKLNQ